MMSKAHSMAMRHRSGGFTLIEAVITIVITGILAGMVAVFIAGPVKGYVDSARRAELTDTADLILRRISREVHLALPNSLRVTTIGGVTYVEFIATSGGGRFRDSVSDQSQSGAGYYSLNFNDNTVAGQCATTPANCKFDVVGTVPANPAIAAGDFIVVYNLGQDSVGHSYAPADAYASGNPCSACNRAQVSAISGSTITLYPNAAGNNVFADQGTLIRSSSYSSNRFHVVPGTLQAVTFACPSASPGPVSRYQGYGFYSTQTASKAAAVATTGTQLATGATCSVTYTGSVTQQHNGLLTIQLNLKDYTSTTSLSTIADSVSLLREIHVDNSP
jgi:MSHA biogenesis protein MshO